jgi:predicted metal-dependent hydrolase
VVDDEDESYENMLENRRAAEAEMDLRKEKRSENEIEKLNNKELHDLKDEDIDKIADEGDYQPLNLEAFECPL